MATGQQNKSKMGPQKFTGMKPISAPKARMGPQNFTGMKPPQKPNLLKVICKTAVSLFKQAVVRRQEVAAKIKKEFGEPGLKTILAISDIAGIPLEELADEDDVYIGIIRGSLKSGAIQDYGGEEFNVRKVLEKINDEGKRKKVESVVGLLEIDQLRIKSGAKKVNLYTFFDKDNIMNREPGYREETIRILDLYAREHGGAIWIDTTSPDLSLKDVGILNIIEKYRGVETVKSHNEWLAKTVAPFSEDLEKYKGIYESAAVHGLEGDMIEPEKFRGFTRETLIYDAKIKEKLVSQSEPLEKRAEIISQVSVRRKQYALEVLDRIKLAEQNGADKYKLGKLYKELAFKTNEKNLRYYDDELMEFLIEAYQENEGIDGFSPEEEEKFIKLVEKRKKELKNAFGKDMFSEFELDMMFNPNTIYPGYNLGLDAASYEDSSAMQQMKEDVLNKIDFLTENVFINSLVDIDNLTPTNPYPKSIDVGENIASPNNTNTSASKSSNANTEESLVRIVKFDSPSNTSAKAYGGAVVARPLTVLDTLDEIKEIFRNVWDSDITIKKPTAPTPSSTDLQLGSGVLNQFPTLVRIVSNEEDAPPPSGNPSGGGTNDGGNGNPEPPGDKKNDDKKGENKNNTEGTTKITNRKGKEYPSVNDLKDGKPIESPPENLELIPKEDRVPWYISKAEADKFRKSPDEILCKADFIQEWYKRGYADPPLNWKEYDIHHILPKEYGGQNLFENLTPVERKVHQTQFNIPMKVIKCS